MADDAAERPATGRAARTPAPEPKPEAAPDTAELRRRQREAINAVRAADGQPASKE